ncbi:hypothetical protein EOE18_00405 [Novosphingobium umbonatum]|uniref:Uncharacterized protein n=1 Tax=Novosphingobium umbonatum TaxID=1908524 RepID=A0A437NCB2_9SPHN|nr:hypothetical protein EOE18_00405 [Novosphingobium umbonatum]
MALPVLVLVAAPAPLAAQSFDLLGGTTPAATSSSAKPTEKKADKPASTKTVAKASATPAPSDSPAPSAVATMAPTPTAAPTGTPPAPLTSPPADDPLVVPPEATSQDSAAELGQESWWPLELAAGLTAALLLGAAAIRLQLHTRLSQWHEEWQDRREAKQQARREAKSKAAEAKSQAAAEKQEAAARYRSLRKPVAPAEIQPAPLPVLAEEDAPDARLAALREQFLAARDLGQSPETAPASPSGLVDITIDDSATDLSPTAEANEDWAEENIEDESVESEITEEAPAAFRPSPLFASLTEAPIPAPPPPVADVEPWTESESTAAIPDLPKRALMVALVPTRFTTSLTQAALRYKLTLHNRAKEPLGPIMLLAALADPDGDAVGPEDVHSHAMLRAGGKVEFSGELKLPLAEVSPIVLGGAELFVPMVQVAIEASRSGALAQFAPYRTEAGFLVGKAQDDGEGKTLAPIRLDAGLVNLDDLAQRAMTLEKPQKHQTKV